MIHFNHVSAGTGNPLALPGQSDPTSNESFESALSDAVSQTLQKFGIDPSSVNISIAPSPKTTDSTGSETASDPGPVPPATVVSSLAPFMGPSAGAAIPAAPPLATPAIATPQDAVKSFNDNYWASQPAAVQQLRNIQDTGERTLMASQLASNGYKIDVPIMAWGWDASQVTSLRQSYGYTWVPSALQNPVQVAPGLSNPGMPTYDPNNPPSGSIAV